MSPNSFVNYFQQTNRLQIICVTVEYTDISADTSAPTSFLDDIKQSDGETPVIL